MELTQINSAQEALLNPNNTIIEIKNDEQHQAAINFATTINSIELNNHERSNNDSFFIKKFAIASVLYFGGMGATMAAGIEFHNANYITSSISAAFSLVASSVTGYIINDICNSISAISEADLPI